MSQATQQQGRTYQGQVMGMLLTEIFGVKLYNVLSDFGHITESQLSSLWIYKDRIWLLGVLSLLQ